MTRLREKYKPLVTGISLGVIYGIISRLAFASESTLASVSFLFLVPTILGIIPLVFVDEEKLKAYQNIIFIPWLTTFSFFLSMFLFGLEDFLCLVVLAAPFFILGTIGALIFQLILIHKRKHKGRLLSLVFLPFILAFIEAYIPVNSQINKVKNEIVILASPATIWENIIEVPLIKEREYRSGFFHYAGVPRPLHATINSKSIGGKRTGNFEGGLTFTETITEYLQHKKISFKVHVEPKTVRQKVFDQHVLNGNYFSFVDATYELENLQNGQVKLTLYSNYQLTSTINFYGKFWGDLMLSDFQERLLEVIKTRCEK